MDQARRAEGERLHRDLVATARALAEARGWDWTDARMRTLAVQEAATQSAELRERYRVDRDLHGTRS